MYSVYAHTRNACDSSFNQEPLQSVAPIYFILKEDKCSAFQYSSSAFAICFCFSSIPCLSSPRFSCLLAISWALPTKDLALFSYLFLSILVHGSLLTIFINQYHCTYLVSVIPLFRVLCIKACYRYVTKHNNGSVKPCFF